MVDATPYRCATCQWLKGTVCSVKEIHVDLDFELVGCMSDWAMSEEARVYRDKMKKGDK